MNLKNLKLDLPKTWQETSRSGNENQAYIWLNHISPLVKVDPKIYQDESLPSPSPKVVITKVGVPSASREPLKNFYEGMKGFILSGFAPPKMNLEWLEKLWKGMTKTPGVEKLGESDFSGDITIARYQTEKIARQSFKNIGLMPTQGFNVPVPGGVKIPGLPENVTITKLLESGEYEKMISRYVPKEQLEKLRSEIKKVQKKISEEVKPSLLKSGVKYKEGKYLGCEAIYVESKNPTPKPKLKRPPKKTSGGGGYIWSLDPLPKISQPYSEIIISYQALLVKNFVITGSLLWEVVLLPSGNTPCYSLTRTTKKTMVNEGITFIDIVPVVSNYAKEGYLHKEEAEKILKKLITKLSVRNSNF